MRFEYQNTSSSKFNLESMEAILLSNNVVGYLGFCINFVLLFFTWIFIVIEVLCNWKFDIFCH